MKKRDRRLTSTSTSLAARSTYSAKKADKCGWPEAVPESTGPSEKMNDTASAFYLDGKGI